MTTRSRNTASTNTTHIYKRREYDVYLPHNQTWTRCHTNDVCRHTFHSSNQRAQYLCSFANTPHIILVLRAIIMMPTKITCSTFISLAPRRSDDRPMTISMCWCCHTQPTNTDYFEWSSAVVVSSPVCNVIGNRLNLRSSLSRIAWRRHDAALMVLTTI